MSTPATRPLSDVIPTEMQPKMETSFSPGRIAKRIHNAPTFYSKVAEKVFIRGVSVGQAIAPSFPSGRK